MLQRRERWLYSLLAKLLADDQSVFALLAAGAADGPAFHDLASPHTRKAPRIAKVDMYHYEMAESLWALAARWAHDPAAPLVWWRRTFEESLVPPVALTDDGQLARAQLPAPAAIGRQRRR